MTTQQARFDARQDLMTERQRPRKLIALMALIASAAAVVVVMVAAGMHLVAFRSLPTTVSWAPSVSVIAPGGDLTISGRISPAESGRQVLFQSAPTARGPWQPIHPVTTTDGRGQFAVTFKPQLSTSILLRVVVDPTRRYLEVTGVPEPVQLLSVSTISIKGRALVSTRKPLTFTLVVHPTSAGRTVSIEQSKDELRWVPVGQPTQTRADGTLVMKVPRPAPGVWSYRATVAQDGTFAAATSSLVVARVEDMKVVAARAAAAHTRAVALRARRARAAAHRKAAQAVAGLRAANT